MLWYPTSSGVSGLRRSSIQVQRATSRNHVLRIPALVLCRGTSHGRKGRGGLGGYAESPGLATGGGRCSVGAGKRRGEQAHGPSRHEVRHLPGTVPPGRGKPDAGDQPRCRVARVAGLARLRRSLDRRTSFRRLGTDRAARTDHRRRRRTHQAHQTRHRRDQPAVSSSVHGGAALRAARPHDARAGDDGLRAGRADLRRLHARHRTQHAASAHAGGDGRHHAAAEMRRAGHHEDRLVRDARRTAASRAVLRSAFRDRGGQHDHAVRHDRGRNARCRRAVDRRRSAGRAGGARQSVEDRRGYGGEARQDDGPQELARGGQCAYRGGRRAGAARR